MARETGVVKWFNAEKGYGFITRVNGEPDVFVHVSSEVEGSRSLEQGEVVSFEVVKHNKGPCAQHVQLA